MADLIKIAEEAFATGKEFPRFKAGDTITVAYKIVEGNKERIQLYRGVVIKINGHQNKKHFTVRKMSGTVGVERIFPIDSPNIESIEVNASHVGDNLCKEIGVLKERQQAEVHRYRHHQEPSACALRGGLSHAPSHKEVGKRHHSQQHKVESAALVVEVVGKRRYKHQSQRIGFL